MTEKLTVPLAQEMRNLLDSLVEEESDFDWVMDEYEGIAEPLPYIDDDQIDQGSNTIENFEKELQLWVNGFKDQVESYGQSIEYDNMLSIIANKISNNYMVQSKGPQLNDVLEKVISSLY